MDHHAENVEAQKHDQHRSHSRAFRLRFRLTDIFIVVAFVGFALSVLMCVGFPSTPYSSHVGRCDMQLRQIYDALKVYVGRQSGVPVDSQGKFSIEPLIPLLSDRTCLVCPGRRYYHPTDELGYVLTSALSLDDVTDGVPTMPVIVACDKPGNHIRRIWTGRPRKQNGLVMERAHLLLSDGRVYPWRGPANAYAEWIESFKSAPRQNPYPPGIYGELKNQLDEG